LNQYPEFVEFHAAKTGKTGNNSLPATESSVETPEETLHKAYQSIRGDLAGEILEKVKSNSPQFFEKLVVDLMVAMGYGGSRSDAGQSIGHSGDEGIDGITTVPTFDFKIGGNPLITLHREEKCP